VKSGACQEKTVENITKLFSGTAIQKRKKEDLIDNNLSRGFVMKNWNHNDKGKLFGVSKLEIGWGI